MENRFDTSEFDTSNPEPRCPCVVLVDTSGSMGQAVAGKVPIEALNQGLVNLRAALAEDDLAALRVDLAIVGFGDSVRTIQDFTSPLDWQPGILQAAGATPMGAAVLQAMDLLEARKQTYRENGVSYFRPWIFVITDGQPTDGAVFATACKRVHEAEAGKKLLLFAVGTEGADMKALDQLSPRRPLLVSDLDFKGMFQWLSASLQQVSRSQPDEALSLKSPEGTLRIA